MATERKIVMAVDDSEASAYAFTWALHNLVRKSDHVVVLTATPALTQLGYPSADIASEYGVTMVPSVKEVEDAEKSVIEDSNSLITKYCQLCAQSGIKCEGEVVTGEPGSWIIEEAERVSADVIVVGSHAHGIIKRTFLGSKSDYVLHNAKCPVAIVRHTDALEVHDPLISSRLTRKIVIAVDESREAVYAFRWAIENFCNEDDKVIIYHVHQSVMAPITTIGTGEFGMEEVYVPPDVTAHEEVEALSESEKLVEKYMEYVAKATKIQCEGMVVTGQTEEKVCEGLINLDADAVVIGTHDRGTLARNFLGSVSDYMSHNSPCPLIVAKMPKDYADDKQKPVSHEHAP